MPGPVITADSLISLRFFPGAISRGVSEACRICIGSAKAAMAANPFLYSVGLSLTTARSCPYMVREDVKMFEQAVAWNP